MLKGYICISQVKSEQNINSDSDNKVSRNTFNHSIHITAKI